MIGLLVASACIVAVPPTSIEGSGISSGRRIHESQRGLSSQSAQPSFSNVLTIPLVSHQTVVQRRRRQSALQTDEQPSTSQQQQQRWWQNGREAKWTTSTDTPLERDAADRELHRRSSAAKAKTETTASTSTITTATTSASTGTAAQTTAAVVATGGLHHNVYVDLWCGTPPQRQTLVVDTTSHSTLFSCRECGPDCGDISAKHPKLNPLYEPNQSSTFAKLRCPECLHRTCNEKMLDGTTCTMELDLILERSSWSAYEAVDHCYIGDGSLDSIPGVPPPLDTTLSPFNETVAGAATAAAFSPAASDFAFDLKFGCIDKIEGSYFQELLVDGTLGMDPFSASFWRQMFDSGKISRKAFALCLGNRFSDERSERHHYDTTPAVTNQDGGGVLQLGGVSELLRRNSTTPMVYSSATTSEYESSFYEVQVTKIYLRPSGIDNEAILLNVSEDVINQGGVIVDSASASTCFLVGLWSEFSRVYEELTGDSYQNHHIQYFTRHELAQQPTIILQLRGDVVSNQAIVPNWTNSVDTLSLVGLAGDLDPDHPYDVLLVLPPELYYRYYDFAKGYISGFQVDDNCRKTTLGSNAMVGRNVYFDIENSRIGWAESSCEYSKVATDSDPIADLYSNEEEQAGFCTGLICQAAVMTGLVATIVFVLVHMLPLRLHTATRSTLPLSGHHERDLELRTTSIGSATLPVSPCGRCDEQRATLVDGCV